jgi:hypothetical protein
VWLAFDHQRERAGHHQVDLLLVLVTMDAVALTGCEHDLIDPERGDAQRVSQPHEPLGRLVVELRGPDTRLVGRGRRV